MIIPLTRGPSNVAPTIEGCDLLTYDLQFDLQRFDLVCGGINRLHRLTIGPWLIMEPTKEGIQVPGLFPFRIRMQTPAQAGHRLHLEVSPSPRDIIPFVMVYPGPTRRPPRSIRAPGARVVVVR